LDNNAHFYAAQWHFLTLFDPLRALLFLARTLLHCIQNTVPRPPPSAKWGGRCHRIGGMG